MITITAYGNPSGNYLTTEEISFMWEASVDDPLVDGDILSTTVSISPDKPSDIILTDGLTSATSEGRHFEAFLPVVDGIRYLDLNLEYLSATRWEDMPAVEDVAEMYNFTPSSEQIKTYIYEVTVTTTLSSYSESYTTTVFNNWTPGRDKVIEFTRKT